MRPNMAACAEDEHPMAAVRLRLPVAMMSDDASVATTRAPSRRRSAT